MVPVPHGLPDPETPPSDLFHLRELHRSLPHPLVRWQTEPGRRFLDLLFAAVEHYDLKTVADALGMSVQGVDYMLNRVRLSQPRRWPSPDDLRDLNAAWRAIRAAREFRRTVRRTSPEYLPVNRALCVLLDQQFDLGDIALAMDVPRRHLTRFVEPPLGSADDVARAIDGLLPKPAGEHASENTAWRD